MQYNYVYSIIRNVNQGGTLDKDDLVKANIKHNILIGSKKNLMESLYNRFDHNETRAGLHVFSKFTREIAPKIIKMCKRDDERVRNIIFILDNASGNDDIISFASFIKNNPTFDTKLIAIHESQGSFYGDDSFDHVFYANGEICDIAYAIENIEGKFIKSDPYHKVKIFKEFPYTSQVEVISADINSVYILSPEIYEPGDIADIRGSWPSESFETTKFLVMEKNMSCVSGKRVIYKMKPLFVRRDGMSDIWDIKNDDDRYPSYFRARKHYKNWVLTNGFSEFRKCLFIGERDISLIPFFYSFKGAKARSLTINSKKHVDKKQLGVLKDFEPDFICINGIGLDKDFIYNLVIEIDKYCETIPEYSPALLLHSDTHNGADFIGATKRIVSILTSKHPPSKPGVEKILEAMDSNSKRINFENAKRELKKRNVVVTAQNISKILQQSTVFTPKDSIYHSRCIGKCTVERFNEMSAEIIFDPKVVPPKNVKINFYGLEIELARSYTQGHEYILSRHGNKATYTFNRMSVKAKERIRVIINKLSNSGAKIAEAA